MLREAFTLVLLLFDHPNDFLLYYYSILLSFEF